MLGYVSASSCAPATAPAVLLTFQHKKLHKLLPKIYQSTSVPKGAPKGHLPCVIGDHSVTFLHSHWLSSDSSMSSSCMASSSASSGTASGTSSIGEADEKGPARVGRPVGCPVYSFTCGKTLRQADGETYGSMERA